MTPSLEYFIHIAKHNNITHAAAELNITQQCLSNYLKKLEEYYGIPLFIRKPVMTLTPFGQAVYKRALMIQGIQSEIEASVPYHMDSNPLVIGFSLMHIYQANQLIDIVQLINDNKDASVRIRHGSLETLSAMLKNGELDAYFTSYTHATPYPISNMKPAGDFINKKVADFDYKVIVSPEVLREHFHKDTDDLIAEWRKNGVRIQELGDLPLIMLSQLLKSFFVDSKSKGYKLNIIAECDKVHLVMDLARAGLGFAVVPDFTGLQDERHGLYQFRISEPEILKSSGIFCCTTEKALSRPIVRKFWNMIAPAE